MPARSSAPALLGLLLVAALLGAAWLLLGDDAGAGADPGGESLRAPSAPDELAGTLPDVGAAEAPAEQPTRLESPPKPPRSTSAKPVARLAGRLLRLADRAPLAGWVLSTPLSVSSTGGGMDGEVVRRTTTDEHGRFVFEEAPLGLNKLQVRSEEWFAGTQVSVPLPEDAYTHDADLIADTGWIVEGWVRSAAGQPLRGALVVGPMGRTAEPAADGRFRLEDVGPRGFVPGTYELRIGAELHKRVARPMFLRDEQRIVSDVHVELEAAGALEGRVLGADNYAYAVELVSLPLRITDAGVRAVLPTLDSSPLRPTSTFSGTPRGPGDAVSHAELQATDEPTHYRVDSVPPGRYVLRVEQSPYGVWFDAETFHSLSPADAAQVYTAPDVWEHEVSVLAGEVTRFDVQLPWGAGLLGQVLDAQGVGLPEARVEVLQVLRWQHDTGRGLFVQPMDDFIVTQRPRDDGSGSESVLEVTLGSATTDVSGEFGIGRLPPGELLVRVTAPEGQSLRTLEREVHLESARTRSVTLGLARGYAVSGRVLDQNGLPLSDARVAAKRPSNAVIITGDEFVNVDVDGSFEIGGLEAGAWELHVGAPKHISRSHEVQAGDPPVDLVLERARALKVRVLNANDNSPVVAYSLTVSSGFSYTQRTVNAADGRFLLDGLDPVPVSLSVSADGFDSVTLDDVQPESPPLDALREIELRLTPVN